MKRLASFLLIAFMLSSFLKSQTVDSIKVEQAGELIKVHYKILNSNPSQVFRVTVYCSINGGLQSVIKSLSGDFGDNVIGGRSDYMVLWDVLKDVDEVKSVDFSVRAELTKDETPKARNKIQPDWKSKKFYILPSLTANDFCKLYGIRLAYMGSWGVSLKYLYGNFKPDLGPEYTLEEPVFSTSLDLTKRIISKGGFQMHLLGGIESSKISVDDASGQPVYYDNFVSFEFGTFIVIRRFVISIALSYYNPSIESGYLLGSKMINSFGLGMRF